MGKMATLLSKVQVVVVGVGWAGGIISAELTKQGIQVVGLERGKERNIDYTKIHDELRYGRHFELMQDLSKETITFRNNTSIEARPMREYGSFRPGDGVGGAGLHWNGQTFRFQPVDFELRSKTIARYGSGKIPADMTIQDWGINYDQIQPYYEKFEATAGISGPEDHPDGIAPPRRAVFNGKKFPTRPMKETPVLRLFKNAATSLGYKPYMIPSANVTESYDNPDGMRINRCEYCGFCETFSCEYDAKAEPRITVIPVAKKTGKFELRTECYVTKVLHTNGKATGVLYVNTRTGEEFEQPADIVVVTSYVLNNAKILLHSNLGVPYDPATGKGVIGKNYAYQIAGTGASGFFEDREFNTYAGAGALGMEIDEFNGDNFDHINLNFIHGGGIRIGQTGLRPIGSNPVPPGVVAKTWGAEWKKAVLKYQYRQVSVGVQGASMPWKQNNLDLDPTYRDAYGVPLLRITFDFTQQDAELSTYLAQKCAEILREMGVSPNTVSVNNRISTGVRNADGTLQIKPYDILPYQSTHNTGGVIMGADRNTSAVNNYLQMWDAPNVFVIGASAFPHNSGYNPTGTVGALAYRAAEGILQYKKSPGPLVK
jgi:gluconate 2-dehydrogenase alpha chain